MADRKSRSAFEPLLFTGVVVLCIVAIAFHLPLENCDGCAGSGMVFSGLHIKENGVRDKLGMERVIDRKGPLPREKPGMVICPQCDGEGERPFLNLSMKEQPSRRLDNRQTLRNT